MKEERELDEEFGEEEEKKGRGVSDLFRKVVVSGVGALFMTEEGIRSAVKELKLPKEVLASALSQADKTKDEVLRIIGSEVRSFLESADLKEQLVDVMTRLEWEVRAEVAFKKGEDGLPSPVVDAKVRVKRQPNASQKAPKNRRD